MRARIRTSTASISSCRPRTRSGAAWPLLVFVHGGGWTSGDKGLRVGGADVYGNIGRFFAAHGVGTAVISYRLQPDVGWREQVDDVEHAVAWLRAHVAERGGDPRAIFLAGHSAGAELATWAALAPGEPPVCGLISVSGAGFDLADEQTYALGASRDYYAERFASGSADDAWIENASVVRLARPELPPALILYAEDDPRSLQRQAHVLDDALRAQDVESRVVVVPGQTHTSIVLTLSRGDRTAAPAMLEFIEGTRALAALLSWAMTCDAPSGRSCRKRGLRGDGVRSLAPHPLSPAQAA